MASINILLIVNETVLAYGIQHALRQVNNLIITKISPEQDGHLVVAPQQPAPDLVIIEARLDLTLYALLEQITAYFPDASIILIDSLETTVKHYGDHSTLITTDGELISTIYRIQRQKEAR